MACLGALLAALLGISPARADGYPSRPVTIINPYAAGSATDLMARGLAAQFQELLGQSFVVTSREGGSGVIGMTALSLAAPDGATLAYTPLTPLTAQPHLLAGTRLGPGAVQPVCGVAENILGIAVNAGSPFRSVDDIVRSARHGAQTSYGSPGPNSGPSLGVEELARGLELQFTHVAYRGDAGALQDLMAGRLSFAAIVAASASPFIKAGQVRLLAVMSSRRHPEFPVPTLLELYYPVTQLSYAALFAPKDTPRDILNVLEQACARIVGGATLRAIAANNNQVLNYQSRAELENTVREQHRLQGESLRASGAQATR